MNKSTSLIGEWVSSSDDELLYPIWHSKFLNSNIVNIKICVIHLRTVKLVVVDMFQSKISCVIWQH